MKKATDAMPGPSAVNPDRADARVPVGVSSCLLGERVRFDGNHKHDAYVTGTLGCYFDLVPFCPEVAIGLGVPRPPIRLEGETDRPRAVGVKDPGLDVTRELAAYGHRVADEAAALCGFILKKGSPSCGMERVKVYRKGGGAPGAGSGVFARALRERMPLLPMEEEGRLGDSVLRENFIARVFAYHRLRALSASGPTPGALVRFHSRHKLLVMAHSQAAYRRMGQLVARAGIEPIKPLAATYARELMTALARRVPRGRHVNVMQHLMGYLKEHLDALDKAEMVEVLDAYRKGHLPLVVPITLLKHHFRRHPHPYVADQYYLNPHPPELMLRNLL
jgi:uncharacterized protein YbgA (DUF1722 family)/uncharacterized protein YbbK (DUF523 family)